MQICVIAWLCLLLAGWKPDCEIATNRTAQAEFIAAGMPPVHTASPAIHPIHTTTTGMPQAEFEASGMPYADTASPGPGEFRGVWISSLLNLDWPSSNRLTPEKQKEEFRKKLDELKKMGINAILLQVRPEADALYASSFDPWSYWLTGEQGRAPDPFFDPLSFAVREAHRRGMQLHAWINPFRVERKMGDYDLAGYNISRRHPEWVLELEIRPGQVYRMLDPGEPGVRNYITAVVTDIVRRYDVDGIHFDDYFYPYGPLGNKDMATFVRYGRGFTDIGDWRRDNINRFIQQVSDSLAALAPDVIFGVSPTGIRKNLDAGTNGLQSYYDLYADALTWLRYRHIDYISPQLYHEIGDERADFIRLKNFWSQVASEHERHLYIGLAAYKLLPPYDWNAQTLRSKLQESRKSGDVQGYIFFRSSHLLSNPKSFSTFLEETYFTEPELTPVMSWKNMDSPDPPLNLSFDRQPDGSVRLSWQSSVDNSDRSSLIRYAVYRQMDNSLLMDRQIGQTGEWERPVASGSLHESKGDIPYLLENNPAKTRLALTGESYFLDTTAPQHEHSVYLVRSVSRNSIESLPVYVRVPKVP